MVFERKEYIYGIGTGNATLKWQGQLCFLLLTNKFCSFFFYRIIFVRIFALVTLFTCIFQFCSYKPLLWYFTYLPTIFLQENKLRNVSFQFSAYQHLNNIFVSLFHSTNFQTYEVIVEFNEFSIISMYNSHFGRKLVMHHQATELQINRLFFVIVSFSFLFYCVDSKPIMLLLWQRLIVLFMKYVLTWSLWANLISFSSLHNIGCNIIRLLAFCEQQPGKELILLNIDFRLCHNFWSIPSSKCDKKENTNSKLPVFVHHYIR